MTKLQNQIEEYDYDFEQYAREVERGWRKTQRKLTPVELLTIFPEAKTIIPDKITEYEEERELVAENIRRKLLANRELEASDFAKWFLRELVKAIDGERLTEIDRHLARLKMLRSISHGGKTKHADFEVAKQQALAVPIESVAEQHTRLRRVGNKLTGLCPLHQERTASFYLFRDTNTFHCFGCQSNGDVITLARLLHGFSFQQALNFLTGANL